MNLFLSYAQADRGFAVQLRNRIEALGAAVWSDDQVALSGERSSDALRSALEAADAVVLVVPEPGSPKANTAYFEAGAARALGKRIVAVTPGSEPSRLRELPADGYGIAVLDGSRAAPEALANSILTALEAA